MALDFKSLAGSMTPRQRNLLLGAIGVGIIALYVTQLALPLWELRDTLEMDVQKLQADLDQKRMIAANRSKLEEEIKGLEKQLAAAVVKLPEEKDIPNLLTQVNERGQQSGLEFLLFRPAAPVKKGFYAEVPIDMRVEGEYHTLATFLDRVSKLERIVNVTDLRINPLPAQRAKTGRTISADLKATTFTFLEKGGSAGAPSK